jgi:DNA-binding protein H-NS
MSKCRIYETLNAVKGMDISKSADGLMTLSGTFGVCGVRNNNQRVYEAGNYGKMVTEMQARIKADGGIPGELEHPSTMNVTLENVSHKITNIKIDENGVVSGTIQLLNTPKGKIAQAIVEGGLPLFVSSRAMGQVDKGGNVTLEKISTYDLVGTPGFSQARMHLNESQVYESLTDNIFIISENTEDNDMEITKELLEKLEKLEERVADLEQENQDLRDQIDESSNKIDIKKLANGIQEWIVKDYSNELQKWITEEYQPHIKNEIVRESKQEFVHNIAPKLQKWIIEDFGGEIERWITEEYSGQVENWVIKQVAPGIQSWMVEHFAPTVEGWLNECYSEKIGDMVQEGLKDTRAGQLKSITETLSMLEGLEDKKPTYGTRSINEGKADEPLYIAQMPEAARVKWNMASQEVRESIQRRAKLYDFTNEGAIDRFWEGIKFEEVKPAPNIYEGLENISDERERAIRAQFRRRRAGL